MFRLGVVGFIWAGSGPAARFCGIIAALDAAARKCRRLRLELMLVFIILALARYEPRLKVICGRNQAGLEKMAATWGWEELSTACRIVIDRNDIDIIDITPPTCLP